MQLAWHNLCSGTVPTPHKISQEMVTEVMYNSGEADKRTYMNQIAASTPPGHDCLTDVPSVPCDA